MGAIAEHIEHSPLENPELIQQSAVIEAAMQLFSTLGGYRIFVKNLDGEIIAEKPSLLMRANQEDVGAIPGNSGLGPIEAKRSEITDINNEVETLKKQVELVVNPDGSAEWQETNNVPIYGKNGNIIGIMGVVKNKDDGSNKPHSPKPFSTVLEFIERNYGSRIEIPQLAKLANLSLSQFEKKFRKFFGVTPIRYVNQHRVAKACIELKQSSTAVTKIATDVGFYDHSHFFRVFKKYIGISPGEYREQNRFLV